MKAKCTLLGQRFCSAGDPVLHDWKVAALCYVSSPLSLLSCLHVPIKAKMLKKIKKKRRYYYFYIYSY